MQSAKGLLSSCYSPTVFWVVILSRQCGDVKLAAIFQICHLSRCRNKETTWKLRLCSTAELKNFTMKICFLTVSRLLFTNSHNKTQFIHTQWSNQPKNILLSLQIVCALVLRIVPMYCKRVVPLCINKLTQKWKCCHLFCSVIYSPLCHSNYVRLSFFCRTGKKIFWGISLFFCVP